MWLCMCKMAGVCMFLTDINFKEVNKCECGCVCICKVVLMCHARSFVMCIINLSVRVRMFKVV